MTVSCSYECIISAGSQAGICQFVNDYCEPEFIDFLGLYFCSLNQSSIAFLLMLLLLAVLTYYFLSTVSDQFLEPSLKFIYPKLGMSQTLAGLTLLAFGNGAPDVLTAIIAGQDSASDQGQGAIVPVGSIFGACLFSTCLILALVIKHSPDLIVAQARFVTRDIGFYILGSLTLLVFGAIGHITWYMALVLLAEYLVYMCFVLYDQRLAKEADRLRAVQAFSAQKVEQADDPDIDSLRIIQPEEEKQQQEGMIKMVSIAVAMFRSFIGITIPCPSPNQFNKARLVVASFSYPFFVLAVVTSFQFTRTNFTVAAGCAISLTLISFCTTRQSFEKVALLYSLLAFAGSLLWMLLAVKITMSFLSFLQILTGANKVFLALTLLALGNSISDLFSYVGAARAGLAQTALSGVYGGQLFNLLVGFGLSNLVNGLKSGQAMPFQLFKKSSSLKQTLQFSLGYIVIGGVIAQLAVTLVIMRRHSFRLDNRLLGYLLHFYILFLLLISCITIAIDMFQFKSCDND